MLCMCGKIDIASGDFNRASRHIKTVLNDFYSRMPDFPKAYIIFNTPNSPEIATVIFVHTNRAPGSQAIDVTVTHRAIWTLLENADFGLQAGDKESHWPPRLKICLFDSTALTPSSARHRRTSFKEKVRKKRRNQKRNLKKALIATAKSKGTATTPKHPYSERPRHINHP